MSDNKSSDKKDSVDKPLTAYNSKTPLMEHKEWKVTNDLPPPPQTKPKKP